MLTALFFLACDGSSPEPTPPPATYESAPPATSDAIAGAPITATLSFDDRHTHMLDVALDIPVAQAGPLVLSMPTWTPGSYLIREFARHVEGFSATDATGQPLAATRVSKNRWQVSVAAPGVVTARYRVYCRERSVRTNYVDGDLAVINGAPTFLTPVEDGRRVWHLRVELPPEWEGVYTGLDAEAGGFIAADFDELVDSPLVIGSPTVRALEVSGTPHRLVLAGPLGPWDVDQSAEDVSRIVQTQHDFWETVPYADYTFLQVLNERGGGLEHLDSTLMQAHRDATATRDSYLDWLGLVSHEFFHTWNIKRLRPRPLGPFDYESEVYTPSLWIAEGVTSYYDDLLLVRSGLMTEAEYLGRISKTVADIQSTPGRRVQTLQQASSEAWIRHYRPDENTVNTAISYYKKGALVALVLDAAIRESSRNARSLDDAMRLAYDRYAGPEGYTPEQIEALFSEVAGADLSALLDRCLRSTDELDFGPALSLYGLRFASPAATSGAWLGADTADHSGRRVITQVRRGTPAHDAGLQVDDELVAVDGWRVPASGEDDILSHIQPGTTVTVVLSRLGQLREVTADLRAPPADRWTIEIDPDASPEAAARRAGWLGLPMPVESEERL